MDKYYVNTFYNAQGFPYLPDRQQYVGLFKREKWEGIGNFCGWYACEFYLGADLLAYYIKNGNPFGEEIKKEVKRVDAHFNKIKIQSIYSQKEILAENDEEAIEKFTNEKY